MFHRTALTSLLAIALLALPDGSRLYAQAVCLPAPRLLTTFPMGGQQGTTVDITLTGENFEDVEELRFSHPGITAVPKRDEAGNPIANQFTVTIAADCPVGVHEARAMTRLGMSSSRVFNVSAMPEVSCREKNTTLETAFPLEVGSICNAAMTRQSVDFFRFEARAGQRIVVDCAARGIDSKLKPVVIVADSEGNDLQVERRGGAIDFTPPADGTYVVKVHDLTFNGGAEYFYRLALQPAAEGEVVPRLASTEAVNSISWPPHGLPAEAALAEVEPNHEASQAQKITLPCDISGSFFPAADVDLFEFTAKAGEVWWVEVASERLGRPTDPSVIVQHVGGTPENEVLTDIAELNDIPSPVKVSSNGYAYDGPPYNAGSTDVLGSFEVKQDGVYRLRLSDLFGGTRTDPQNVYRLIVRQAQPDFAVVGWALHMQLRNGDRNALSKPIALRGGATMAFEVVVIRRDGFDGPIDLVLENLPEGVTATGLTIPAGKGRGIMLITAREDAPRGLTSATFVAQATINGETVTRHGRLASMAWPVTNAWAEIPAPRLVADIPVSVGGDEQAPLTIAPADDRVYEAKAGESLTIPLVLTRRSEFSGPSVNLRTFGEGFESNPRFDIPLTADTAQAVLDLANLKTPPGEYTIAFYGPAVARYQYNTAALAFAQAAVEQAKKTLEAATAEAATRAENTQTASADEKPALEERLQEAMARQKAAQESLADAEKRLAAATKQSAPKDIADIVVSTPIHIRVLPAEEVTQR